jgi:pyruvate-formate lyase-activating enzyme/diadenosine tetraphosphatase ApaH/serine/threonine PP2A family protein phosphatase
MTRIAVFGGVYSNPYALRALLEDAPRRGAERLFCLGDLGGFGAEPEAVWPLLVEGGVECMAGNYDIAIGRGDDDCGCGYTDPRDNEYAQLTYDYTKAHTSREFAAWMRRLPTELGEEIGGCDVHMVHGSPLSVNDFFWESLDDEEVRLRVTASGADVLLCTHTGLPWVKRVDGCLVANVGVLGRPANDGRREVWYALVDLEDGRADVEHVPLAYDWRAQARSMRAAGIPEAFVATIETGWWATCLEILPPAERARGKYQLYKGSLPTDFAPHGDAGDGAAAAASPERGGAAAGGPEPEDDIPVMPLFGSPLFPPRLWIYTNFHCNLRCGYCAVSSSPLARRRSLGYERFCALVDEAVAEGFTEVYVTGGEPFLEPDIVDMLDYASRRLPTVVLTNGMLFRGRRGDELRRLAGREDLMLQVSVDGARPETHDVNRGDGSWKGAMDGIAHGRELGLPIKVRTTETPENRDEIGELGELLAGYGITGGDFSVQPLVARGNSDEGLEVGDANTVPELTVTADGIHWHPAGGDVETSPDMWLAAGEVPLAEAKRLIIQRFLELREADGSLPRPYACAV